MPEYDYWAVDFSAEMNNYEADCPGINGILYVRATDIFDALEKARKRIESFGFDKFSIEKTLRGTGGDDNAE